MDRRTILAIVLSALVLIFVPMLLELSGLLPERRPPETPPPTRTEQETPTPLAQGEPGGEAEEFRSAADPAADPARPAAPTPAAAGEAEAPSAFAGGAPAETTVTVETDLYRARFSNRGARLLSVQLNEFRSAGDGTVLLSGQPTLVMDLGDGPGEPRLANALYTVSDSVDAEGRIRALRFVATGEADLQVAQTYRFEPETYVIHLEVAMDNVLERGLTEYYFELHSWPLVTERNLKEDLRSLQAVARVGTDVKRDRAGDLIKKGDRRHEGAIRWAAVRSKYFSVAVVPEDANANAAFSSALTRADEAFTPDPEFPDEQVRGGLVLPVPPPGRPHTLRLYAGPNDYWGLEKVGDQLEDVVDLGWRWLLPFSKVILGALVFLERYIPNYGIVIIVLSVLVKVLFHPLTAASMKSMRGMQKVQPELQKLRDKHKNDPQKMNQAVMQLYREHKVNPLGGCLPLIIQMPVLFALYQVFLHAIELRQAHFFLWINDLSSPDALFEVAGFPIRVLPLVMYGSAYLQQRFTPTDPRQRVTFHLMNLFLVVLFYNLPSGLVLYWTVTNLLTAVQQYLITHEDRQPPAAKAA